MSSSEEERCFTIYWKIENVSLLLANTDYSLRSPCFDLGTTEAFYSWRYLFVKSNVSNVVFNMFKSWGCIATDRFNMFFISSGSEAPLKKAKPGEFSIEINSIVDVNGKSILPNDTLTVCCKVWDETIQTREYRMHSVLLRLNYLWNLHGFNKYHESSIVESDIPFFLQLREKSEDNNIHTFVLKGVNMVDGCVSFISGKISLENNPLNVEAFSRHSDLHDLCESCEIDIAIDTGNSTNIQLRVESTVSLHKVSRDRQPSLSKDLIHLFQDKFLSDATLKAGGQSFPAHRNILSARSPVLRSMFEKKKEMTEGLSGVVDIEDIDAETVNRMLVFIYSDSLGELSWEEAMALYYAADKYDIRPLKAKCRDILTSGLSVSNVFDAVRLAHRHSDQDLMKIAVNFCRENKEVMSSPECLKLEESDSSLGVKILREVYVEKQEKCKLTLVFNNGKIQCLL